MDGKKAKCMIVCAGEKKKLKITVCVDRDTGDISKQVEETDKCDERIYND